MDKDKTKAELVLEIGDVRTSVSWTYEDVTLEDLYEGFRGMLVAHTFMPSQIDNFIMGIAEEINDKTDDNMKLTE